MEMINVPLIRDSSCENLELENTKNEQIKEIVEKFNLVEKVINKNKTLVCKSKEEFLEIEKYIIEKGYLYMWNIKVAYMNKEN